MNRILGVYLRNELRNHQFIFSYEYNWPLICKNQFCTKFAINKKICTLINFY